ncbi:MAG TPA: GNAT family N-acetyltransferase [Streptosporangiales bacterium]
MTGRPFTRTDPRLGRFTLRPVDPAADAPVLHSWVTHPKAEFWQMADCSVADVAEQYRAIADSPWHEAYLGLHEGAPAFLVERYDPRHDEVGRVYRALPGDVGMHFLVAPADQPVHGFTRAVIGTVMEMLFADDGVRRVVVEPDVRNTAVHVLNEAVGFRAAGTVELPDKTALLSFCTRADYEAQ